MNFQTIQKPNIELISTSNNPEFSSQETLLVKEVKQMEEQRYQAMLGNQVAVLEHLLSEDLLYVHSTAIIDTKTAYLSNLRAGTVQYKNIELENVQVDVYNDTAVVTGRILISVILQEKERFIDSLFVNIWIKQNERWQLLHWQSTPVPK